MQVQEKPLIANETSDEALRTSSFHRRRCTPCASLAAIICLRIGSIIVCLGASTGWILWNLFLSSRQDQTKSNNTSIEAIDSTPSQTWHPAVIVLCGGILLHLFSLWQGTRAALQVKYQQQGEEEHQDCDEHDDEELVLSLIDSLIPISHAILSQFYSSNQKSKNQDNAVALSFSSHREQWQTGSQVCVIAILFGLTMLLVSSTTTTTTTSTLSSSWKVGLTILSLAVLLTCTHRLVAARATICRLYWLNAPILSTIVVPLSKTLGRVFVAVGTAPRYYFYRPAARCQSAKNTKTSPWWTIPLIVSAVGVSLASTLVVLWHMGTTRHGVGAVVAVPILWILAGLLQGIPIAAAHLTSYGQAVVREHYPATCNILQITSPTKNSYIWGSEFLTTICWLTIATLVTTTTTATTPTSVYVGICVAAIVGTASSSLALQALAQDFPIWFLMQPIVTYLLLPLSQRLESISSCVTFLFSPLPQHHSQESIISLLSPRHVPDKFFIGTYPERLAISKRRKKRTQRDDHDYVESTPLPMYRCKHIASYPAPTYNPEVLLEEHAF